MAHSGTPVGKAAARPLQTLNNHRELIATIFPQPVTVATTESPSVVEDQEILHCAASQGILLSLLVLPARGGFYYDLPDRFGRTPLHWAAEQGHRIVALALLRSGACVDPRSQRKATPIMLAASRGHAEVVGVLLQYHAGESDCSSLNRHRRGIEHWRSTALHCAAAGGHVRVVELLLDAGFDRGQHDGAGLTPAEISARQSHSTSAAITRLLLPTSDMGGKLVHDYVNTTMLDVAMVSGLVKGGAFLDWRNGSGGTPLHRAVQFRHATILRILLQAGADPNIHDHGGASPLQVVATTGYGEVVVDLLEAGADLQPRVSGNLSPLLLAVINNKANVVSLLLNAGAPMEHRDTIVGQTPLSWACRGCLAPTVRVLVEAGADLEARCSAGLTPLHWACRFIDTESVNILLNAGADPSAVDLAAAKDAVETSRSRNRVVLSIPIAVDVIGLGCPPNPMEDSGRPFTGGGPVALAARRLDIVAVWRMELDLRNEKQQRSWRRRGWLVILANRWVAMGVPGVRDDRSPASCRGCVSPCHRAVVQSRYVDTGVEQPPCAHEKGAAGYCVDGNANNDTSYSQHPKAKWSRGQDVAGKKQRSVVRSVGIMTRAASRQQGQARGNDRAHEVVAVSLQELVDALLGLLAIEAGVFRRVVRFI